LSKKTVITAARIDYLVDYAKKQFKDYKGLHLNSKDWEAFINIGTAQFYSFIVNGVIKFYTTTSISGKRYDQIFKFTQFKLVEPVILLLFLTGQDIEKIIDYTAKFLSLTEVKLFCPCPAFCLEENTNIDLLDGRILSIKEIYKEHLKGKTHYVYSINKDNDPTVNKINKVWISGEVNELIKITLDNDFFVITTPEHYYIKRDGTNVMAKDLNINDSLMPIYFNNDKNGYKQIKMNSNIRKYKSKSVHRLVAEKFLSRHDYDKNVVIHHKDFNKCNNIPDNLLYMDKIEHIKYHAKHINKNRNNVNDGYRNWIEKMKKENPELLKDIKGRGGKATYKKHPKMFEKFNKLGIKHAKENREFYSILLKERWKDSDFREKSISNTKKRWEDSDYKEKMIIAVKNAWTNERKNKQSIKMKKINKKVNSQTNKTEYHKISCKIGNIFNTIKLVLEMKLDLTEENFEQIRIKRHGVNYTKIFNTFNECIDAYYNVDKKNLINSLLTYNHKIKNIEYIKLENSVKVYDLEVENDHNFYVSAGVVLHNSYWGPHYNLTKIKSAFGPGEIRPPDIRDPKRNNLVCKHLWIVLRMYEKYIREFAKGMVPYYKRQFGINSPTGVQRLKKNLGMKGFKKIVQQAILNLHKINDTELLSLFNTLTENRLKDLLTTNIEIPSIPKEELNKTPEQIKEEAEKELEEEEKAELIDPEEEKKEEKVEEKEKEEEKSEVINVNDLKEILKKEKEKESSEKSTETENPEAKDYKELMTSKRIIINDYIIDHFKKNKRPKIKKHEDVILPEWKGFVKKHEKIISEDTN